MNNQYVDCPPIMADARNFTDYRPNYVTHEDLLSSANVENSHEYRQYMIRNAIPMMNVNRKTAWINTSWDSCHKPSPNLGEKYRQECNDTNCNIRPVNYRGSGLSIDHDKASTMDCQFKPSTIPLTDSNNLIQKDIYYKGYTKLVGDQITRFTKS